jgi:uncharacterized membrane protein YGL010W
MGNLRNVELECARLPEWQSSLDYSARHEVPGALDERASRVQPSGFTPFPRAIVRTVDTLFERYGEFHRNPVNKVIHWVCVPLIVWSLLGMLWALSPIVACIAIAAAMAFYVRLSLPLALGMLIMVVLMVWLLTLLGAQTFWACLAIFVAAWIGQFVGHLVEGRKPAFLEDMRSLLVGPAWILAFVYRRLGISY